MMFNREKRLRNLIRWFIVRRKQQLVLEELWRACKYRFYEDTALQRKALLVEIIDDLAKKEIEETLQWLEDQRNGS